jgi:hypothetical protein
VKLINEHPRDLKFLFYTQSSFDESEIDAKIPNYYFGNISHFSYFITNKSKTKIQLSTFEWWTKKLCGVKQLKVLGVFDKKFMKWKKNGLKVPKKFNNFHNCTLVDFSSILQIHELDIHLRTIQINDSATPFFLTTKALALKQQFEHELSMIFARRSNYRLKQLFRNDSTSHVHRMMTPIDARDDYHYLTKYRELIFGLVIPKGGKYDSYEKMTMPFDRTTWMCLISLFCSCFVVIFIVRRLPEWVSHALIGIGVNTPGLNVVRLIFGFGQSRLPLNNSARIIFVFFIMACEVFKTAYQG